VIQEGADVHHLGFDHRQLAAEHRGDVHRQVGHIAVKAIGQQSRQHVWAGTGELEWQFGQRAHKFVIFWKV